MKNTLIQFIPNVPSTNKLLLEMADRTPVTGKPVPPFFTLHTDFQSDGRGMGANRWFSDPGQNILVSFYFEPNIPANRQFLFNQYFALATLDFIRKYIPEVQVKWPNDIYVYGKKMAGILIEHVLQGERLHHTVAGIGLNVNQDHFPDGIPHPTSLFLETGQLHDPDILLNEYWQILRDNYAQLSLDNAERLHQRYLDNMYQHGEIHEYLILGERKEAKITGLDEYGRLVLIDKDGQRHTCGFKEIVFL